MAREAGFEFERLEPMKLELPIPPFIFTRPHILGIATPPPSADGG